MPQVFDLLTKNDNPLVALLSSIVIVLSAVVAFQWRYSASSTVPKWVWDNVAQKLGHILEVQENILTVLDERLKKK